MFEIEFLLWRTIVMIVLLFISRVSIGLGNKKKNKSWFYFWYSYWVTRMFKFSYMPLICFLCAFVSFLPASSGIGTCKSPPPPPHSVFCFSLLSLRLDLGLGTPRMPVKYWRRFLLFWSSVNFFSSFEIYWWALRINSNKGLTWMFLNWLRGGPEIPIGSFVCW